MVFHPLAICNSKAEFQKSNRRVENPALVYTGRMTISGIVFCSGIFQSTTTVRQLKNCGGHTDKSECASF
jgi:hypothetical protein